jgi:putative heme-binding domain-containing protein
METLLNLARWGWISRDVFVDETAMQVISPRLSRPQKDHLEMLTKDIDVDSARLALLARLQQSVLTRQGDAARGKLLYDKHCAACHQLRGQGAVVGPQLDGAATRSVVRLLEDVVTPDQNVDRAFRTTSFLLDDGRVIAGLVTSENDAEIIVVQSSGKPVTVVPESVERRREAGRSLMPSNMGEVLSADELSDLIRFVRGT